MKTSAARRSEIQLQQRWQLHSRCECEVRQTGPHWGVYCARHGTWIQWIGRDQAQEITQNHCKNK
jgi:hypothetical protein